jgi:WD40 repeat protein
VGRFQGLTQWVRAGALSPDGARLVTGNNDGALQVWDVESGKELKRIERRSGWINWLAVAPDGRHVLVADREVALYDLESGKVVRVFEGHGELVQQAVLSPDGRHLLTGCYDGIVRLWDFRTGRLIQCLGKHDGFVCSVAFSPNGLTAASAGGGHRDGNGFLAGTDHDIRLWDVSAVTGTPSTVP